MSKRTKAFIALMTCVALSAVGMSGLADGAKSSAATASGTANDNTSVAASAASNDNTSASSDAESALDSAIGSALTSADKQGVPGGFVKADGAGIAALDSARAAYVAGDNFLYINDKSQLVRRANGAETILAENARALTHVSDGAAYVLLGGAAADSASDDHGWGDSDAPAAPDTGRELKAACDWAKVSLSGGAPETLLEKVGSVPVISGGYAYATRFEDGALLRLKLDGGAAEQIYAPDGKQLRLSPAPQGVICAQYDEGLLTGCCAISESGAVAVGDWAADAEFFDGFAVSRGFENDGTQRAGLYIETAVGETQLDAQGRSDYLYLGDKLYYWHADPAQAYGFCDLMQCDPASGKSEAIPAGAQLRGKLFSLDGELYFENYDSELYKLPAGATEPEYAMDLTVEYDFDKNLLPEVTLYKSGDALCALLYLDEGAGYKFIGEVKGA